MSRRLSEHAVEAIAEGSAILGTGGGGDPYLVHDIDARRSAGGDPEVCRRPRRPPSGHGARFGSGVVESVRHQGSLLTRCARKDLDAVRSQFTRCGSQRGVRRTAVLAQAAETGALEGLEDREQGRRARLATLVPELDAALREAREDAAAARALIAAADHAAGLSVHPSRSERIQGSPELSDLVDAARQGLSLLYPKPLPQSQEAKIVVDDGRDDAIAVGHRQALMSRRVGYLRGGQFGNVDTRPRTPTRRPGKI